MPAHITFFVHDMTADNEKETSSGWADAALSELGVRQSIGLKGTIKNQRFNVLFCSAMKRAVDSAQLTFESRVPIIPDLRLRECNYGKYSAPPSSIVGPLQEMMITERFPNGECYEDVKLRMNSFLDHIKKNYAGKSIAIVAHKAPQLALDVLLKDKTWKQAFAKDWRKTKSWKPGWVYILGS